MTLLQHGAAYIVHNALTTNREAHTMTHIGGELFKATMLDSAMRVHAHAHVCELIVVHDVALVDTL